MKLDYIIQGLEAEELSVKSSDIKQYVSTLIISDYIKVVAYHNNDKDVDQLEVLAVMTHATGTHYKDISRLVDKCTYFMSDLTLDLRVSMLDKISFGELNDITLDLDELNVSYKLQDNGLLVYKVMDKRD